MSEKMKSPGVIPVLLAVLLTAVTAGSCAPAETGQDRADRPAVSEEMKAFAEAFKAMYIPQDDMASGYTKALGAVEEYALFPTDSGREQAAEILRKSYNAIEETELAEYGSVISEEAEAFMEERGMSAAEFSALCALGETDRQRYLDDLERFEWYLEETDLKDETTADAFQLEAEYMSQVQSELNRYMYYATNEFLAALEENELEYMTDQVFSGLDAYAPDDVRWQQDAEDAYQKQEECWSRISRIQEKMEEETGKLLSE